MTEGSGDEGKWWQSEVVTKGSGDLGSGSQKGGPLVRAHRRIVAAQRKSCFFIFWKPIEALKLFFGKIGVLPCLMDSSV